MKPLHRRLKHNGGIICIGLYIVTWFVFGILYCYVASATFGQAFIFHDDILLQTKNHSFQKDLNIKINNNITKELFLNYDKHFILTKMTIHDSPLITINLLSDGIKPIGINWANYYITKWKSEDYNFCAAVVKNKEKIFNSTTYCKLIFSIYSMSADASPLLSSKDFEYNPDTYSHLILKKQEFYIWIDEKELDLLNKNWSFTGCTNPFASLEYGKYFISYSINYLDPAIDILYNYETQLRFKYPFIDFLYFSAVTITNLGYGDILPNSSLIRGFVMVESIMGAIILAISISFLFEKIKLKP